MSLRRVLFQPDYFMSAQFAGLAVALRGGAYTRAGIEVQVLPLAGAGESAEEIQSVGRDTSGALVVGSTEQNILIPAQRGGAPVQAVASMFGTSPLSLAGLPGLATGSFGDSGMRIGVHDDTVDLVKRLLPSADVVSVGREDKMGMLIGGKLDAVQVYDCMETLKMERDLGALPSLLPLEGLGGARLGYAQVLFASDASLADPERRALLRGFLQAPRHLPLTPTLTLAPTLTPTPTLTLTPTLTPTPTLTCRRPSRAGTRRTARRAPPPRQSWPPSRRSATR